MAGRRAVPVGVSPKIHSPSRKGGHLGGKAAASRPASARSKSAKKGAATRKRNAEHHAQH